MKKVLISGISLIVSVFVAHAANAEVITVGDCEDCDYGTIQAGVDAAVDSDTVSIQAGTYEEDITVPRGLEVYINGDVDDYEAVEVNGSFTINGRADAEIRYLTINTTGAYGVKVKNSGNADVKYGTVKNAQRNLVVDRGGAMLVYEMTLQDASKHNIVARHNAELDVQNSTLSGSTFANLRAVTSKDVTVTQSTIKDAPRGIFLWRVKDASITKNDFENISGAGIFTRHSCDVYTNDNDFTDVTDNQIDVNAC